MFVELRNLRSLAFLLGFGLSIACVMAPPSAALDQAKESGSKNSEPSKNEVTAGGDSSPAAGTNASSAKPANEEIRASTNAGKKDAAPDELYKEVSKAKDLFDKGDFGASLNLLNTQLATLTEKDNLAKWQVLSDIKLCLLKLNKKEEAEKLNAEIAELAKPFKMAAQEQFTLVPENSGTRAIVATMVLMTAINSSGEQVLLRRNGDYAVASATPTPSWMKALLKGRALKDAGKYTEALPLLLEGLKGAEANNASMRIIEASYSTLGGNLRFLRRFDDSIVFYRKSMDLMEKENKQDTAEFATDLDNIAQVYEEKGDYITAGQLQRKALNIYEKVLPPDSIHMAKLLCNFAGTLHHAGALEEAENNYNKGIEIYLKQKSDDVGLAMAYDNFSGLYAQTGRLPEAETKCREALALFRKLKSADHPDVTICVDNLAGILDREGKNAEAKKLVDDHLVEIANAHSSVAEFFKRKHVALPASPK